MRSSRKCQTGFTLIELLVVMAIIGLLMGLTFFGLAAINRAQRVKRTNQQITRLKLALDMYYNDYRDYPDATDDLDNQDDNSFFSIEALHQALTSPSRSGPYLDDLSDFTVKDQNANKRFELLDTWDVPFRYEHSMYFTSPEDGPEGRYLITSAGPDSEFGTADDIFSWKAP